MRMSFNYPCNSTLTMHTYLRNSVKALGTPDTSFLYALPVENADIIIIARKRAGCLEKTPAFLDKNPSGVPRLTGLTQSTTTGLEEMDEGCERRFATADARSCSGVHIHTYGGCSG
jgi:hypothetical protein